MTPSPRLWSSAAAAIAKVRPFKKGKEEKRVSVLPDLGSAAAMMVFVRGGAERDAARVRRRPVESSDALVRPVERRPVYRARDREVGTGNEPASAQRVVLGQ